MPNPVLNLLPKQKNDLAANGLISGAYGSFVGVPTWVSGDATKIVVKPSRDGLTCECISLGPTGTATVTVSAVGTGPLTGAVDLTVGTTLATSLKVAAAGAPKQYPGNYP
jgi:hypothetical protein